MPALLRTALRGAAPTRFPAVRWVSATPLLAGVVQLPRQQAPLLSSCTSLWRQQRWYAADEKAAEPEESSPPAEPTAPSETVTGDGEAFEFGANTKQLLDIVANSLYTDKEVFVRELVSNASDALNKLRQLQLMGDADGALPLEVKITCDEEAGTVTIADTGIGMGKDELIANLGTIARSGSKAFVQELGESTQDADMGSSIIGRFGVGFYSAFMVADKLTVFSRRAGSEEGFCWESDGTGNYTIAPAENVAVGTKVVISLKDKEKEEFGAVYQLRRLIKKYSNFVSYPISLQGERVNQIEALWTQQASQITKEQHTEFYRFIANSYDTPRYHFQFAADAPIAIQALLYVPHNSPEKFGMGKTDGGISVYSRKVLIKAKADNILPEWLRFLKGVVDSEDLPLNISRENMQDSALIERVGSVVTRWLLGQLAREAKRNPADYDDFYKEFGQFIKEGACTDNTNKAAIAKLLRFDSSYEAPANEETADDDVDAEKEEEEDEEEPKKVPTMTSLAEVNARALEGQKKLFYLAAPSKESAKLSPYYEAFAAKGVEVLFIYNDLDEYVMTNIGSFDGKVLLSCESNEASKALDELPELEKKEEDKQEDDEANQAMDTDLAVELTTWMEGVALDGMAKSVKAAPSGKLLKSPAMISSHESATQRRWMKLAAGGTDLPGSERPKEDLEVNTSHPILRGLAEQKELDPELAKLVAEQLYDNALVAAGLLEDPRVMVPRLQELLARVSPPPPSA